MNHTIDVYGNIASPPCRAVMLLLAFLNIKTNLITINIANKDHLKDEFIKMNPLHTIPTINDDGFILYDSHAIMAYLVNKYAVNDSLYPKEAKKQAIVNERLFFNVGTFWPRYGDYVKPVLFNGQSLVESKAANIEEALNYLDLFVKDHPWMAGSDLTIADFAIVPVVSTLEAIGFDISKFPYLDAWYDRIIKTLINYEYEEINQNGADIIGNMFNSQLRKSQ